MGQMLNTKGGMNKFIKHWSSAADSYAPIHINRSESWGNDSTVLVRLKNWRKGIQQPAQGTSTVCPLANNVLLKRHPSPAVTEKRDCHHQTSSAGLPTSYPNGRTGRKKGGIYWKYRPFRKILKTKSVLLLPDTTWLQ